jgi:hypothetical protein
VGVFSYGYERNFINSSSQHRLDNIELGSYAVKKVPVGK